MSVSAFTVNLVKKYCLEALQNARMTTDQVYAGIYARWRDDVVQGNIRLGRSTVYEALVRLESCGVLCRVSDFQKRNGRLRYYRVWSTPGADVEALPPKKRAASLSPLMEQMKREIRTALAGRSWVTLEGVKKATGSGNRNWTRNALVELVDSGEIDALDIELNDRRTLQVYKLAEQSA